MLAFWKNWDYVAPEDLKLDDFNEVLWIEIDDEEDCRQCEELAEKLDIEMPTDVYTIEEILKVKAFVLVAETWIDASDYKQKLDEADKRYSNIWDTDC